MNNTSLVGFLLLALVVATVWMHGNPEALPDGSTPVATSTKLHFLSAEGDVDGVFTIKDADGTVRDRYYLLDGQLYEPPGESNRDRGSLVEHLDFITARWDLGTWAAYFKAADGDTSRFQPGLRWSPVRVGFNLVALDAVVSSEVAGLGASLYPPRRLGRWWAHWGLGAWYVAPFDGGGPGLCVGLSFSTRD